MKRKIIVGLIIAGIVFSGVNIDFKSLKAEGEVLTIINKGNSYDYPTTAIAGQPYTVTVKWTQNFDAKTIESLFFIDEDCAGGGNCYPGSTYGKTWEPGLSAGSHSHTFTVTTPNDGRSKWNVRILVIGFRGPSGSGDGDSDQYRYTITIEQPLNPPKLNVTWHVPSQFEYGEPNPLWLEVCNSGGDADVEREMWISGYSQGYGTWHMYPEGCITTGWRDDFYVSDKYIQDGYVTIRFWAKATNKSGTDTYDETKKIPVVGMEGSIKVIVKDDSGDRLRDAKIYLDGSYEGKTNSSGEYTISNLAPNEYKVEASKSGYYGNSEYVYLEAGKIVTVYLTLEEIPPTTTTPSPTTPKPTTPKPTTPRPTTPSPTTPPPTKSPCDIDSDNDGVPDCEDECENTPPEYYVDNKGCKVCLSQYDECAVAATGLIPLFGIVSNVSAVINDLCLINNAIKSGEPVLNYVVMLTKDTAIVIAEIILAAFTAGWSEILLTGIEAAGAIKECGFDLADGYGADKSFYTGVYEGVSQKLAEENIDSMTVFMGSPAKLIIKDEEGNTLSENNKMGIPIGFFYEHDDYKMAFIINPEGEYKIETIGTDEGTYDLKIKTIRDGKITKSKEFDDVQTSQGKVDTYNVNIASSGKVDIEKSGESSFKYLLIVAIILLISIIGFYVYRGKKGGMAGPPRFGERSRLAKKLDKQYETGKMAKDEYFQKMKDLELSPENKILKKLEEKFARGEIPKEEYLQKKRDLEV